VLVYELRSKLGYQNTSFFIPSISYISKVRFGHKQYVRWWQ